MYGNHHHQHHRNVAIHRSRLTTRPNNCVPSTCPNTSVRVLNRENSGPSTTSQSPSTSSTLSLNPYGASSSASLKYVNCTISNYDTSKWIRIISFSLIAISLSKKREYSSKTPFFQDFALQCPPSPSFSWRALKIRSITKRRVVWENVASRTNVFESSKITVCRKIIETRTKSSRDVLLSCSPLVWGYLY